MKLLYIISFAILATSLFAEEPSKAQQTALEALRSDGFLAQQIAIDNHTYDVNFKLAGKPITDTNVKQLEQLGDIVHSLNLANTDINDARLVVLAKMPKLKRLHLENTGITDKGLAHLKGLAELEYLNLYGSKVTDAGLDHLAGLTNLKKVFFWQSGVTEEGAKKLFAKLPNTFMNLGSDKPVIGPKIEYAKPVVHKPEPETVGDVPEVVSYTDHIKPILERSCVSCHGEKKQKGKMRLDTPEWITKADIVVNGDVDDSEMHVRLLLPADDDDFMPPPDSDAKPLTKTEVAIVAKWIKDGAKF